MPVYSRKMLRQSLGQGYMRDTIVALTEYSMQVLTTGAGFGLNRMADTTLSGQGLYENVTIRHVNMPSADYRVASFNTGSGAWVTPQLLQLAVLSHDEFEVHSRLPAMEKDRAIDDTLKRVRVRQEVGITTVDNEAFYSIEGAASPHYLADVLDAYYYTSPAGSLSRGLARFDDFRLVTTATGRELRISPVIGGSQQIILDAILQLTLGASDAATINLPDDRWVLAGAAAKCYDLMIQNAPGQNAGELANRRKEWAGEFSRLSGRFAPLYERKVRLGEPGE